MRAATASLALVALLGACTFPTVDFADAGTDNGSGSGGNSGSSSGSSHSGSSSASSGGCGLAATCSAQATSCAANARAAQSCDHKCKMPTSNPCVQCTMALQGLLAGCVTQCASCAQTNGCAGAGATCQSLVGPP